MAHTRRSEQQVRPSQDTAERRTHARRDLASAVERVEAGAAVLVRPETEDAEEATPRVIQVGRPVEVHTEVKSQGAAVDVQDLRAGRSRSAEAEAEGAVTIIAITMDGLRLGVVTAAQDTQDIGQETLENSQQQNGRIGKKNMGL